jgi:hypothetical protein
MSEGEGAGSSFKVDKNKVDEYDGHSQNFGAQ